MPLEGQWERQHSPLRPGTRRERRILAALGAVLAVATVAVVVAVVAGGGAGGRGCVSVTGTYSTGGAELRQCGRQARAWCREQAPRTDAFARAVQASCRRAGVR